MYRCVTVTAKSNLGTVISQSNQIATNRTKRQPTYQRYQRNIFGAMARCPTSTELSPRINYRIQVADSGAAFPFLVLCPGVRCGRRLGQTWVGSMPSWLAIRSMGVVDLVVSAGWAFQCVSICVCFLLYFGDRF